MEEARLVGRRLANLAHFGEKAIEGPPAPPPRKPLIRMRGGSE